MRGLGYKEGGGVTRDEGFELYSEVLGVRGYAALCDLIVPVGATTPGALPGLCRIAVAASQVTFGLWWGWDAVLGDEYV